MVVEHVNHDGEWPAIQKKAGTQRLLVADFYADWCVPCRMIAPHFENLSNQYKDAVFAKVNVDKCSKCITFELCQPLYSLLTVRKLAEHKELTQEAWKV
uniref:Thioredoxin domain-containing protein n=1 Tax=Bursaphelenchus xylophilus TaxID=6326 RepID=A0A1I7SGJ4_BURXY